MSNQYGPRIVTNGLVLCLDAGNSKSYPGSGIAWNDLSGNNNHGTLINGPTYSSSNKGSIVFDGINDYVNLGSSNNITGNNIQTLSISLWLRYSTTLAQRIFTLQRFGSGGNSTLLAISINEESNENIIGRLGFVTRNFVNNSFFWLNHNDNYHTKNKFINITAVVDNLNRFLYIDGILRASDTNIGLQSVSNNTDNAYIGCNPSLVQNYTGNIGSLLIYRRVLNANEIQQNYNTTKGRFGL